MGMIIRMNEVTNQLSKILIETIIKKKSSVMLSADLTNIDEIIELIEEIHEYIIGVKTHADIVNGEWKKWNKVIKCCKKYNLLIMEDRKFADIGKITNLQMKNEKNIASWADLVTAHGVSGPDIIDGIVNAWNDMNRLGGVILLAQMSSRGNLVEEILSDKIIKMGSQRNDVIGYIGNGSNKQSIQKLKEKIGEKKLILTPGIHPNTTFGDLGQRYGSPDMAISAGADIVIIGSAIIKAKNRKKMAKKCADLTMKGWLERN